MSRHILSYCTFLAALPILTSERMLLCLCLAHVLHEAGDRGAVVLRQGLRHKEHQNGLPLVGVVLEAAAGRAAPLAHLRHAVEPVAPAGRPAPL